MSEYVARFAFSIVVASCAYYMCVLAVSNPLMGHWGDSVVTFIPQLESVLPDQRDGILLLTGIAFLGMFVFTGTKYGRL